jgi:predicted nucleotidyltransferase
MGIINRDRPAKTPTGIADALFSTVQQRVLGLLFGNTGRSYYANEIIAHVRSGTGAVQRELTKLAGARLVTETRIGNQRHFQANRESPVFDELRSLIAKTAGVADVLRAALLSAAPGLKTAFIFGSVAKGKDTASSDIDLMVVDDAITYADLFAGLDKASKRLHRTVNPTIYTTHEFKTRIRKRNAFVTRALSGPKIWLIGDEHGVGP